MIRIAIFASLFLVACTGDNAGYDKLGEGQWFKLQKFGEDSGNFPEKNVREFIMECIDGNMVFRDTLLFRNLTAEAIGNGIWTNKLLELNEGDSATFKLLKGLFNQNLLTNQELNSDTLVVNVLVSRVFDETTYLREVDQKLKSGDLKEQVIFLKQVLELRGLNNQFTMYKGGFYKMLNTGSDSLLEGEEVCLNYCGTLLDGKVFDKSLNGGLCYTLGQQSQVISGLDMMARKACDGDSIQIYLPPYLAFGERGVPGVLPPYAMVIYNVGFHKKDTIPL